MNQVKKLIEIGYAIEFVIYLNCCMWFDKLFLKINSTENTDSIELG